jgi:hypothetical protein
VGDETIVRVRMTVGVESTVIYAVFLGSRLEEEGTRLEYKSERKKRRGK